MQERLGYEIKQAQQALRGAMDAALHPLGLTTPQYAALTALEDQPKISSAELARRCFVTPQTMAGVVANLQRAGLVARHGHPTHRRVLETTLTDRARRVLRDAHRRVRVVEDRMVATLPPTAPEQMVQWLRRCTAALR